ncbi:MAG: O-antigen ligase family protein [Paludibacteraceae bacterium]|nr:O-antigen ligase family protein [Paludibacteraceae bacterium]
MMVLKEKYVLYLYVLLWVFYDLQSLLDMKGSALSLGIVLVLNVVSLYYLVKVNLWKGKNPTYLNALNLLVLMFTVYGVIHCLDGPHYMVGVQADKPYNYLKSIYNSLLPIYIFYYFACKGSLNMRLLSILVFVFFFTAILSFWNYGNHLREVMEQNGVDRDGFVNNLGYEFLALFPILSFFRKRPVLQYVGMIVLMSFLLLGMKRGAILIGFLCMLLFLLEMFKSAKRFNKIVIIVLSLVAVLVVTFFLFHMLSSNQFFQYRLRVTLEGNSSGRDLIYSTFFNYLIYDTSVSEFLFGAGANATLEVFVNYAHNDWLELAVNQGVLGVLLYAYYWYAAYKAWKVMDRTDGTRFAFGLVLFIFFMRTIFSMSYGSMNIYVTCVVGYCLGTLKMSQRRIET